MQNTGDVIKQRREELKLTQMQLAEALGCSQPNIRKIEQGSTPDIRIALKIERVLGLDIKKLFLEGEKLELGVREAQTAYQVDSNINEVVKLMNSTDERGRQKIKLAAQDTLDLHNNLISRTTATLFTPEELQTIDIMRRATSTSMSLIKAAVSSAETTEASEKKQIRS